jgi:hypothetical protein
MYGQHTHKVTDLILPLVNKKDLLVNYEEDSDI